jgi:hypothetical protein
MGRSVSCSDRFNGQANGDEVIFSFVDGFVWLSWPGAVSKVRVGGYENVTTAMQDFLAQCQLAERLANGASKLASGRSS